MFWSRLHKVAATYEEGQWKTTGGYVLLQFLQDLGTGKKTLFKFDFIFGAIKV